jgi:hypothetical protein
MHVSPLRWSRLRTQRWAYVSSSKGQKLLKREELVGFCCHRDSDSSVYSTPDVDAHHALHIRGSCKRETTTRQNDSLSKNASGRQRQGRIRRKRRAQVEIDPASSLCLPRDRFSVLAYRFFCALLLCWSLTLSWPISAQGVAKTNEMSPSHRSWTFPRWCWRRPQRRTSWTRCKGQELPKRKEVVVIRCY